MHHLIIKKLNPLFEKEFIFDSYACRTAKDTHFGIRRVNDFVIVHPDKEYLKSLIPELSNYLLTALQLTLHPKKIYLQHYSKGVQFLGTIIKPNGIYIARRTKGNFYAAIQKQNSTIKTARPGKEAKSNFLSSMNSYLGIMQHYKTYKLRKRMLFKNLNARWWNYVFLSGGHC